ncbi:hypothetical protein [Nocardia mangyaensis]|uniref:hypothetical protein n=1 Tax=Nocardia mangyaensis TaxID=2213200 RepID=UPI00267500CC|nr:hypothetical protein [Nocardia mangyaensis]MDO3647294.1 hypothetical protein [Nocardia mangyaensis]
MAEELARDPDVGFTLTTVAPENGVPEQAAALSHRIAKTLAALGPPGWTKVEASFAMTAAAEVSMVVFHDEQERFARVFPSPDLLGLLREHRHLSASMGDGPWWRYLVTLTNVGRMEVDFDYGDDPFPDDQLFPPTVYRTDIEIYPRDRLPVWLAAYVGHGDRQTRSPRAAAEQARADAAEGRQAVGSAPDVEFPALDLLARRWALIAAAFVAVGSKWGPRVTPAFHVFEGSGFSGATLCLLPGGRAVLSGGVWDAPELDAVYNRDAPMPQLYLGAPEWVADPVINRRATNGLLTFCYWWEGGRWYRGASPGADALAPAVPGMWDTRTVVEVLTGLLGEEAAEVRRRAVAGLVEAAERAAIAREAFTRVFPADTYDVDSAWFQLNLAGLTGTQTAGLAKE